LVIDFLCNFNQNLVMCQSCYNQGYSDYPEFLSSSVEHRIDYIAGYKEKQSEMLGEEENEDVSFCHRCYENGTNNEKIGIWSPPRSLKSGHFDSYEKGYYKHDALEAEPSAFMKPSQYENYDPAAFHTEVPVAGARVKTMPNYYVSYENGNTTPSQEEGHHGNGKENGKGNGSGNDNGNGSGNGNGNSRYSDEEHENGAAYVFENGHSGDAAEQIAEGLNHAEMNLPQLSIAAPAAKNQFAENLLLEIKNRKVLIISTVGVVGAIAIGFYAVKKTHFDPKSIMTVFSHKKTPTAPAAADTAAKPAADTTLALQNNGTKKGKKSKKIAPVPAGSELNTTLSTVPKPTVAPVAHKTDASGVAAHKSTKHAPRKHKIKKHKHKKHRKHRRHRTVTAATESEPAVVPNAAGKIAVAPPAPKKTVVAPPADPQPAAVTPQPKKQPKPVAEEQTAEPAEEAKPLKGKISKKDKVKETAAPVEAEAKPVVTKKNIEKPKADLSNKTVVATPSAKNDHSENEDRPSPRPGRYYTFRPVDESSPREEKHNEESEKPAPKPIPVPVAPEPKAEKSAELEAVETVDTTSGLYPIASKKLLVEADIAKLNKEQMTRMLNEILARRHFIFKDVKIKSYFAKQKWYSGTSNDVMNQLSDIEKKNIKFLNKHIFNK
jgi:YARHG domain